ncbi:MAG TPA: transporter [Caulobacteraceae bacterium]|jgi:hypothetical protein|nr:transporter [Caulobacteraceae bacterium]
MRLAFAAALSVLVVAGAASAAEPGERPFCPARPGKASPACTVDAGRVQLEIDAFDETFDKAGGVKTTDLTLGASQLRIGLTADAELQLAWTPYERQTAHGAGIDGAVSGVGDAVAGLKFNLTGNSDGFGAALQPFVKLPTAPRTIGDGKVEGGLTAPLSIPLAGGWSLGLSPEVDVSANESGSGYHAAGSLATGVSHALTPELSFGAELWVAQDFVSRSPTQASADLMLAWTPGFAHDLQFDVGVNLGLTPAAAGAQAYAGIAKRF